MKKIKVALASCALLLVLLALATLALPSKESSETGRASPYAHFEGAGDVSKELKNIALQYHDRLEASDRRVAELENRLGRIESQSVLILKTLGELQVQNKAGNESVAHAEPEVPRIESFETAPNRSGAPKTIHVPAGSYAEGTLLTGILAPVSGDALPVLIRLDSVLVGPNRSRLPLKGAFLIGKATGDANSSRAVIQLHLLSHVNRSGEAIERNVNGWIVDADGIQGLKGRYVWNAHEIAALSIAAGMGHGMAQALQASQTSVIANPAGSLREVTGSARDFVLGQGASSALSNVTRLIEERMREFTPGILVSNRERKLTAVLLQGVELPSETFLEDADHAKKRDHAFSGLDRDE